MRIFLADDDAEYSATIVALLAKTGLPVERVASAHDLKSQLSDSELALVVVGLPPEGVDHAMLLREVVRGRPCIILATDDREAERITALELGADDVIAKAAPPREIVARVRGVLRRVESAARWSGDQDEGPAPSGGWQFLPEQRDLLRPDGTSARLTTAEFRLLEVLISRQAEPVSRERLFREVFGRPFHPFDRAIDTLVAKLRSKLGDTSRVPGMIRTVRPIGYTFTGFR